MNWQTMTKEQKQLAVLGTVIGLTALYALINFVIKPALAGGGGAGGSLQSLEAKLEEADQLIRQRILLTSQFETTQSTLVQARREHLPATDNPLSWGTRQIYRAARAAQVEVESVEEVPQAGVNWADKQLNRNFQPYAVRIQFKSGYFNLVDLVHELEAGNPYLAISSINISPIQETVARHQVQMVIEWPSIMAAPAFDKLLSDLVPAGAEASP